MIKLAAVSESAELRATERTECVCMWLTSALNSNHVYPWMKKTSWSIW